MSANGFVIPVARLRNSKCGVKLRMAESDSKLSSSPVASAQRRTAPADVFAYKLAQDDLDDSTSSSQQISQLLKRLQKSSPRAQRSQSQHFGDIMEGNSTGVVVMADFTPLERVVLTANGNLQRIISKRLCLQRLAADSIAFVSLACICYHSSYYNAPVDVAIDKCEHIGDGVYDRAVTLSVAGVKFCIAKSIVTLHSTVCKELVDNKTVGIGQLFRHLDTLPQFTLMNAGRGYCDSSINTDSGRNSDETAKGRQTDQWQYVTVSRWRMGEQKGCVKVVALISASANHSAVVIQTTHFPSVRQGIRSSSAHVVPLTSALVCPTYPTSGSRFKVAASCTRAMLAAAHCVVKARLITIPFSHFCEKSRFALDLSPLAYTEEAHAPGFHRLALKGLVEDASKNSVPLLILEQQSSDNKTVPPVKLQCSTRIMQYLHSTYPAELGHWFPTDEKEYEEALHFINNDLEKLGVHARRWAYAYLLEDAEICKRVWSSNVPFLERAAIPLAFNTIRSAIVKGYKATPEKRADLDERLSDGRRYILGGDKISAVDITFAALSYPLLAPPEFDSIAFRFEDYPAEMKAVTERLRQSAAGKHALRLYHEESDHRSGVIVTSQLRIVCAMYFQEKRNGCAIQLVGSVMMTSFVSTATCMHSTSFSCKMKASTASAQ
eukprot:15570-Heterococcus_DN1.PRE.2